MVIRRNAHAASRRILNDPVGATGYFRSGDSDAGLAARLLPDWANFIITVSLGAAVLAGILVSYSGLLPNLTAAREYFADRYAALLLGHDALPYENMSDPVAIGALTEGWSKGGTSPDRRLHASGCFPRSGALAASAVSLWFVTRTLLLMLTIQSGLLPILIYDSLCLCSLAFMLAILPRNSKNMRDYGRTPWALTVGHVVIIPMLFLSINSFLIDYGISLLTPTWWLMLLTAPPAIALITIPIWRRMTAQEAPMAAAIDYLPPRHASRWDMVSNAWSRIVAFPAFTASYLLGAVTLFAAASTLGDWMTGNFEFLTPFLWNLAFLPLCLGAVFLVAVFLVAINLTRPAKWTAWAEGALSVCCLGAAIYADLIMESAAAAAPSHRINGLPFSPDIAYRIMMEFRPDFIFTALISMAAAAIILLISWKSRFILVERSIK